VAKKAKEISWTYEDNHPHIEIRIRTVNGKEYPVAGELLVLLDTGYSGGVILPIKTFENLELGLWENPNPRIFEQVDGTDLPMREADGFIFIPKLNKQFKVKLYAPENKDQDSNEILLGIDFMNNLKLILNGPDRILCVVE